MESQVFGLINGERSTALIEHSGLLAVAQAHSQEMAVHGGLDHNDADTRISNAPADPPQASGGPDAGFAPAAWCENVTYSTGFPESEVAHRLYEQWRGSAPHQACMTNSGKNVGAVGIYFDGSTWWATFIAEVDRTPPGGSAPQPASSTSPSTTAQPSNAVPAAGGRPSNTTAPSTAEPVAAKTVESAPKSSDTMTNMRTPKDPPHNAQQIGNAAPTSGNAVRQLEIDVAPAHMFGTLLRAKRAGAPVPERSEIAGLVGIALIAFRRVEKRPRLKRFRRQATDYAKSPPDVSSFPLRGRYEPPYPVRELTAA